MPSDLEEKRYNELAAKFIARNITKAEEAEFINWYHKTDNEEVYIPEDFAKNEGLHRERIFKKVNAQIKPQIFSFYKYGLSAAAIIVVTFLTALFFYLDKPKQDIAINSKEKRKEILPGKNAAILILGDGKKIALADIENTTLEKESEANVTNSDGKIMYGTAKNKEKIVYNTIVTSRGMQYQVGLPDGSKAWLNAMSSLKFPTSFVVMKERVVEITGEAYFEVAKDKLKAFKVLSNGQTVTVYGTHFNINGYEDEGATKTTLMEGSVSVNGAKLKPNEQSILTKKGLSVIPIDASTVAAWKDGYFKFDEESLESIMKKVSRWYNIDVEFEDKTLKNVQFGGVMTRFANLSKLLYMLELTGEVHFEIAPGKILITKGK